MNKSTIATAPADSKPSPHVSIMFGSVPARSNLTPVSSNVLPVWRTLNVCCKRNGSAVSFRTPQDGQGVAMNKSKSNQNAKPRNYGLHPLRVKELIEQYKTNKTIPNPIFEAPISTSWRR
jgi:hypothetical protein